MHIPNVRSSFLSSERDITMPIQAVRSFIFVLVTTISAYIPYGNALSAQETSFERLSPKPDTAMTNSITGANSEVKWAGLSTVEQPSLTSRQYHTTRSIQPPKVISPVVYVFTGQAPLPPLASPEEFRVSRRDSDLQPAPDIPPADTVVTDAISPVVYQITDQVPVPSLVNPEEFRVPTSDSDIQPAPEHPPTDARVANQVPLPINSNANLPTRKKANFHSVAARPKGGRVFTPQQKSSQANKLYPVPTNNENSLLDQLPVSNLHQGIVNDALSQAIVQHTVGDPYLANRSYGISSRYTDLTVKTWRSPNMKHRPLYFEEANLERYGHTHPRLQPLLSGAHFFSSVALLPYNTGITRANTCQYSIGYSRPGDCVPKIREQHPLNARAALRQAVVVFGGVAGL